MALTTVVAGVASAQTTPPAATPAPAPAAGAAPAAPAVLPIIPFNDALTRAATDLLTKAQVAPGTRTPLVIDPLIDGVSGAQSVATRGMQAKLAEMIRKSYPQFDVQPFNRTTVANNPVVLVGTFTAVNNAGDPKGDRDAYRICLALADLKSGKIISKGVARANPQGINVTPTTYYRDSPAWAKDLMTETYIKTCQASAPGTALDKFYTDRIQVAAVVSDAINLYNDGRYAQSLALYNAAAAAQGGDQMRVYTGQFLANWKLGRKQAAAEAFAKIVDHGLANEKLNIKFLFRPGTAAYVADRKINGPYPLWIKQIAQRAETKNACLEVVGHTSKSGPEPVNMRLSMIRATTIVDQLAQQSKTLGQRLIANGVGSKEALIGTGRDDASDALDRRVEFKTIKCT